MSKWIGPYLNLFNESVYRDMTSCSGSASRDNMSTIILKTCGIFITLVVDIQISTTSSNMGMVWEFYSNHFAFEELFCNYESSKLNSRNIRTSKTAFI